MLQLKNIVKDYVTGNETVHALRGVSVDFRENEFVSILGQSGCGKTTLLNIIGGLDRYTDGDLIIDGRSTRKYSARDWDTYRNHRIGFVFQSYNLIPHQNILSNVELALTLSGVSKRERRQRAANALKEVGLGNMLHKKPNQLSGGQMQRVAIARALVNDPDIILADEPTGALDSETSVQIMDLLKSISENKLIIMVTHNPEIAEKYSTRIIRLFDGKITDDSEPFEAPAPESAEKKTRAKRKKHSSMSFFTALSLSFKNLLTKKARTLLTSFAGSIGIIGIALILSLSNGIQLYINKVEAETLSSYPIMIEETTLDMSALVSSAAEKKADKENRALDRIYSNNIMTNLMDTMISGVATNNMRSFKDFIENGGSDIKQYANDIEYKYDTVLNLYKSDTSEGVYRVNPNTVMTVFGSGGEQKQQGGLMSAYSNSDVFTRLIDNDEILNSQYEVLAGKMPESYDEVIVIVNKNHEITDFTLYALGIKDVSEVKEMLDDAIAGKDVSAKEETEYSYDEILGLSYKLLINTDYYEKNGDKWVDKSEDELFVADKLKDALEIKVVGIVCPSGDTDMGSSGLVGYKDGLMTHLIERINDSEIVKDQRERSDIDIFSGLEFSTDEEMTMDDVNEYLSSLPDEERMKYTAYIEQMKMQGTPDEKIVEMFATSLKALKSDATFDGNMKKMGVADFDDPDGIYIYPKDFEAKDSIADIISAYNADKNEADKINYTDYIGLILSSITKILNAISYILIAFVAISLFVSSIMIGVITYISVLERTKEIGVLRAMGASKLDISRVFNAETLIVGFISGIIGIGASLLIIIPLNAVIHSFADISASAALPPLAGVILVLISMFLTFIAGLIPSIAAAMKDPVVALRTE